MPRNLSALVVIALLLATPAMAQEARILTPRQSDASSKRGVDEPIQLHITDLLLNSETGRASLQDFHEKKAAGTLERASASKSAVQIGARQNFKVFNLKTEVRETIDFTLKETSERFNIWVETEELTNGHVRDQEVEDLRAALADATPAGSVNPSVGIIVNDENIFGDPPDVDGDSKTDVLLVDVRDDFDPDNGNNLFVGGFFDPADLTTTGNNMDILYLDTMPSIVNSQGGRNSVDGLLGTAAHEYQHLIHANYDENESTFVNEAQSEWGELMNGYNGRSMAFLSSLDEHATAFFIFRSDVLTDRERGQLFTLYIAEQLGVETAGSVTRQPLHNQSGYETAFGSIDTFHDLVNDFFTANLLNDSSVDPRFGYSNPFVAGKRTIVDETIDGRTTTSLDESTLSMLQGTVHYTKITNVSNPALSVDASSVGNLEAARARLGIRALTKENGGTYQVIDLSPSDTPTVLSGDFDEVILIITHKTAATGNTTVSVNYSADWSGGGTESFVESVAYDNGNQSESFFLSTTPGNAVQTTRFSLPSQTGTITLDAVQVTPFFLSEFDGTGVPTTAPRDFKLLVLGDNNGTPDLTQNLFELDVVDPRAFGSSTSTPFTFVTVDLKSYADQLNNLPSVFHIGFGEAGSDDNHLVHAGAAYDVENLSFLGDDRDNSWGRLWDVVFANDAGSMMDHVFPIRADFLITTVVGVEDNQAVEQSFALRQNYPNPFSGATTVEFDVPSASDVTIEVFDLLGRKVETVADGLYGSGTHTFTVDASGWANGMYLYRLRSGSASLTRSMSVLN
ncbi:MAG: T9SS type A sorting domain-containing protein [Rhodothermales bacterium]|nr:T9SS type A sorting domain-containing protein [Rhodothermales bacterium]